MKQQDTKIVLWGLFFSLLAVALYAVVALCKRRKPDLSTAINILISAGGIIVGIRLIGFAVTGQLKLLALPQSESFWTITLDDAPILAIGGLALIWVSLELIWDGFRGLLTQPTSPSPPSSQFPPATTRDP